MGALALLLFSAAAGFAAIRALWPAPRRWSAYDPMRLAFAGPLGLGLLSCAYFGFHLVIPLPGLAAVGIFVAGSLALAGAAWWRAADAPAETAPASNCPRWLAWLFAAAATLAAVTFLCDVLAAPHGEWDAWSIWNLRARFLYLSPDAAAPFSALLAWSHPDYPLLLPGAIAALWTAGGAASAAIPGLVAFVFLAATVALPTLALRHLRGWPLALTAGIALAGTGVLVRGAGMLYADVPLTCLFAAAVSFLLLAADPPAPAAAVPLAALAGLAAGLAAWTKNEGQLFCAVLALTALALLPAERRRLLLPLLAGMLVILAVVGHFKFRMAPPNDLVGAARLDRLTDFGRYGAVAGALLGGLLSFGPWLIPPVIVFGVWLWLVGVRRALPLPIPVAVLQFAGYFFTYVLTADRLNWHLEGSVDRLLLHLWPLFLLGVLLAGRETGETNPRRLP